MECVCADIGKVSIGGLYWADPATRTSLPFSSHKRSSVGTTDSHGPRDINLKSLHEAVHGAAIRQPWVRSFGSRVLVFLVTSVRGQLVHVVPSSGGVPRLVGWCNQGKFVARI